MIQIGLCWWFQAHVCSSHQFGRVAVPHKLACVEMGWNNELDFKRLVTSKSMIVGFVGGLGEVSDI